MKTMKYTTGLLFLAACLSFNVARAADEEKPKGDRPERGERMKEMMEKRAEELKAADIDKDGSLSLDEFKAHSATKAEEMFKKLDKDSDGKVTEAESKAPGGRGDRDGGGKPGKGKGPKPDGDKPGDGKGPKPEPGPGFGPQGAPPPAGQ